MKIQTLSAVIGDQACDAGCKFCVSGMTGFDQLRPKCLIDRLGFQKAMRWAEVGECTTCLLTGKGEPTFYPKEITSYLQMLEEEFRAGRGFPSVELQTNALRISQLADIWHKMGKPDLDWAWDCQLMPDLHKLQELLNEMFRWRQLGLDYLAISVVDTTVENNQKVYLHHRHQPYLPLEQTIEFIHALGFRIRLCVMMHKGMVDSPVELERVIAWCKANKVEQLTARPIRRPDGTVNIDGANTIIEYTNENGLSLEVEREIYSWIQKMIREGRAKKLMTLMHGKNAANVYDVEGQNFCLSDCLTIEENGDDIRTLIFNKSGDITYDWVYQGAKLR